MTSRKCYNLDCLQLGAPNTRLEPLRRLMKMSTDASPTAVLLPPLGLSIAGYDRERSPSQQPASVPQLFLDAMRVREEVFVHEQGVPLENELDSDDARSWHWVVYAGAPRSSDLSQADGAAVASSAGKCSSCSSSMRGQWAWHEPHKGQSSRHSYHL